MEGKHDGQAARLTSMGNANLERCGLTDAQLQRSIKKLDDLHEATEQKVFQHGGEIILGPPQPAHEIQLRAVVERLKIANMYPNKLEHEVTGGVVFNLLGLDGDRV